MAIAGLGNASLSGFFAAGVLRGDKTEKRHDLFRIVKPRKITKFRHHSGGNNQGNATQCLIRLKYRKHAPSRHQLRDLLSKPLQSVGGFLDSVNVLLNNHLLCRSWHLYLGEPAKM